MSQLFMGQPNSNKNQARIADLNKQLQNNNWTTYLAYFLKSSGRTSINDTMQSMRLYEAFLCQCSYFSRMAYSSGDIFCRMTSFLNLTPNAFNDYIRVIEKIYDNTQIPINYTCSYNTMWLQSNANYQKLFNIDKINISSSVEPEGYFLRNSNGLEVYLYYYSREGNINLDDKVIVAFKGTSSMANMMKNLQSIVKDPLSQLSSKFNNGASGSGFIQELAPNLNDIVNKLKILANRGAKRIVITGHSLGGALASLFGYYLRITNDFTNIPIHIVTFGEPTVFDDIARNDFNRFLNSNVGEPIFTYDRIDNVTIVGGVGVLKDVIPTLPPMLSHPGFNLLKTEVKSFTKTGRTDQIKEVRGMLGFIDSKGNLTTNNDYLSDEEFVKLFSNYGDFVRNGKFDSDYYKNFYRVPTGTNLDTQIPILMKALPDAKENEVLNILKTSQEKIPQQSGGQEVELRNLSEPAQSSAPKASLKQKILEKGTILQSKATQLQQRTSEKASQLQTIGSNPAVEAYKKLALTKMPNHVIYNCYKIASLGYCHSIYMGVTYVMVLRIPSLKSGDTSESYLVRKKEPAENYTLYKMGQRLISLNDTKNANCIGYQPNKQNNKGSKNVSKIVSNNDLLKPNFQGNNSSKSSENDGFFSSCHIL